MILVGDIKLKSLPFIMEIAKDRKKYRTAVLSLPMATIRQYDLRHVLAIEFAGRGKCDDDFAEWMRSAPSGIIAELENVS